MALYQRLKRQILSRVYLVRVALALVVVAGLIALWAVALRPLGPVVLSLWRATQSSLPSFHGRTNFLVLGREGRGAGSHRAGTDLTDTIILISVHQSGDTVLLSISRDVWIPTLRTKINAAYYYGEQRQPGTGGLVLAKAAVEETIAQPVHYALAVDFEGFETTIDLLGGVDIEVERSFVDRKFPVPGREDDPCDGDPNLACRYQTAQFTAGRQHMDGQTALKYVRSRQAEGEEGTDFARSKRQERLLLAVKDRLLSIRVVTNLRLLRSVSEQVSQRVVTDIDPGLYLVIAKLGWRALDRPLRTATLTEPDWVYHPPVSAAQDGQWVLLPAAGLGANVENLLAVPIQQ